jgi:hypothetical protein
MINKSMKFFIFFFLILVFLIKTGNVLSYEGIFNVNNIEIDKKHEKNNKDYLNSAFIKGFDNLIKRILLEKDYEKTKDTPLKLIKSLISHYQVIHVEEDSLQSKKQLNLFFDKEKINDFFYNKDISYSNIEKKSLVLFPLLIKKNNFYIYNDNYFFNNWSKFNEKNELIEYIIPIENLENIQKIKKNINNLEDVEILDLIKDYESDNYSFFVVNESDNKVNILLKCLISKKLITRNFIIIKDNKNEDAIYEKIIYEVKRQILEIIKSQNIIDLKVPSFLNITLDLKTASDLLNLQSILKKIDIIEKFIVMELNKNEVKIKIKYYGKIDSISQKFKKNGIRIFNNNNQWKLSVI